MELRYCNSREISKYKEAFVLLAFSLSVQSGSFEWKFSLTIWFSPAEVMLKEVFLLFDQSGRPIA